MSNTHRDRYLNLDGTINLRDLGGYQTHDQRETKWGILLRSGNLDQVPLSSQTALIDYGVNTVIDLRDQWEQAAYPNVFTHSEQVTYYNLPVIGDNDDGLRQQMEEARDLTGIYILALEHRKLQIRRIIEQIANKPSGCAIIHCVSGKDRTGQIAALVLGALGVVEETIIADYALTEKYLDRQRQQWTEQAGNSEEAVKRLKRDMSANAQNMRDMIAYLKAKYGSLVSYLQAIGISDQTLQMLQDVLLK
jgi:protein-tyrosine phosphatase